MPEYDWVETMFLVLLWVGLIYGLFGLVLVYLALTDLEWRQLIAERLRQEWQGLKLRGELAALSLTMLTVRGYRWLLKN